MRGGHDLGGQPEMGPINPEPESQEPVFHADWERRVFALTLATGMLGKWNIDESRHARERQDPLVYIENSYYENWLEGLEKLLLEKGMIDAEELQKATASPSRPVDGSLSVPSPENAEKILASGASSHRPMLSEPLFRVGDRVTVRQAEGVGHTRAPKYSQGSSGLVSSLHGCHSYPDSSATGVNEGEQLYTISFRAQDLWGPNSGNNEVLIDLWEPYLEVAEN